MRRTLVLFLIALFALGITSRAAFADVVILRNGNKLEGQIVGQNRTSIQLKDANGTQTIAKENVARIQYRDYDPEAEKRRAEEQRQAGARRRAEAERKRKEQEERLREEVRKREEEERKRKEEELREAARRKHVDERFAPVFQELTAYRPYRFEDKPRVPELSPEEKKENETVTTANDIRLSWYFLPGTGQFARGQNIRGTALMVGSGLGGLLLVDSRRRWAAARSEYDGGTFTNLFTAIALTVSGVPEGNFVLYNQLADLRRELKTQSMRWDTGLGLISLIAVYNWLDLRFFGSPARGNKDTNVADGASESFQLIHRARSLAGPGASLERPENLEDMLEIKFHISF